MVVIDDSSLVDPTVIVISSVFIVPTREDGDYSSPHPLALALDEILEAIINRYDDPERLAFIAETLKQME